MAWYSTLDYISTGDYVLGTDVAGQPDGKFNDLLDKVHQNTLDLDSKKFAKTGGTINGAVTIVGNLHVDGDTTSSGEVTITDNIQVVNYGETGSGVTLGVAGYQVDRGTAPDAQLLWTETGDKWQYGVVGSLLDIGSKLSTVTGNGNSTSVAFNFLDGLTVNWNASHTHSTSSLNVYSKTEIDNFFSGETLGKKLVAWANVTGKPNGTDTDVDTSGATIIDNLYMTDGIITSHGTRVLTLANLGFTGDTNANYFTYTHPTGSGNYHMPSGGTVGQVIRNTASGNGTWQDAPEGFSGDITDLGLPQYLIPFGDSGGKGTTDSAFRYKPGGNLYTNILRINDLSGSATTNFYIVQPTAGDVQFKNSTTNNKTYTFDGIIHAYNIGTSSSPILTIDAYSFTGSGANLTFGSGSTGQVLTRNASGNGAWVNGYSHPTGAGYNHLPTGGTVGQVLTNTASGQGTWQNSASGSLWTESGSNIYFSTGNVGIGTTPSGNRLEVSGTVSATNFSGSGASVTSVNASQLNGRNYSTTRDAANTLVIRDGSGYTNLGWINTTSGNTTSSLTDVFVNTNDGYIRKMTKAEFQSQMGISGSSGMCRVFKTSVAEFYIPRAGYYRITVTGGGGSGGSSGSGGINGQDSTIKKMYASEYLIIGYGGYCGVTNGNYTSQQTSHYLISQVAGSEIYSYGGVSYNNIGGSSYFSAGALGNTIAGTHGSGGGSVGSDTGGGGGSTTSGIYFLSEAQRLVITIGAGGAANSSGSAGGDGIIIIESVD